MEGDDLGSMLWWGMAVLCVKAHAHGEIICTLSRQSCRTVVKVVDSIRLMYMCATEQEASQEL